MAQIFEAIRRYDRATELREKARELFEKFNTQFWNEAEGFYAYALDGDKKPIWSVASNPGQSLWSGIVPMERAERVGNRLMQPDMFSAWGIRTLSANHPSFNPLQYQIGSVWPQDNGLIAQGMKRYEQTDHALCVAVAILNASRFFKSNQIPELYADLQPCGQTLPAEYLGSNVPQGWAAGSVFSLLQVILGFQPDAPGNRLYIDPTLPEWMSELIVRDVRLGSRTFDIHLFRNDGHTGWDVLKGQRHLVKPRAMRKWHKLLTAM
jgi:glycogen debranching enzyme